MRTLTLFLLLATVAAPALAAPEDRGGRRDRGNTSEPAESRSQRASASERAPSETRRTGAMGFERGQARQQPSLSAERERSQQRHLQQERATTRGEGGDQVRIRRRSGTGDAGGQAQASWQPRERQIRTIPDTSPIATRRTPPRSEGLQSSNGRRDYRDGNYTRWSSTHWRRDGRYDWRRYRDRHRSHFRLGFYYDPFGWNYRRWYTGSYLYPSYYSSNFWLHDPWYYRLPHAYGPYRWVRYWNDALLVNVYTGEVVDVIRGFFW